MSKRSRKIVRSFMMLLLCASLLQSGLCAFAAESSKPLQEDAAFEQIPDEQEEVEEVEETLFETEPSEKKEEAADAKIENTEERPEIQIEPAGEAEENAEENDLEVQSLKDADEWIDDEEDPQYGRENGLVFQDSDGISMISDASQYTHADRLKSYTIREVIDVSKYQGSVDWNKVKRSGIDYAFIRVGYRGYEKGTLNLDSRYKENIKNATAAGMQVGVYFFSQAITEAEAIEEANYMLSQIKGYTIKLPVVIDFEYAYGSDGTPGRLYNAHLSKDQATAVCRAFCETVKNSGYTPMVYANRTMLKNGLHAEALAEKYQIWIACYANATDYNGTYTFWQYTSGGSVDGIAGRVDKNFWYVKNSYGDLQDGIYVIHSALNDKKVIDVTSASKECSANIQLYTANGTNAQKFCVKNLGNGTYMITSYNSGMAVAMQDENVKNGTNVLQYFPFATNDQKWKLSVDANGYYTITSAICDKVIDVKYSGTADGTNIHMYQPNGSKAQKFRFEKVGNLSNASEKKLENGTYIICSSINTGKAVDVANGSLYTGANVQLYTSNNTSAQKFVIEKNAANGLYTIKSKKSGLSMVYENASLKNGTNVYQDTIFGKGGSQWKIKNIVGDYYVIYAGDSNFCLDIYWGKTADKTNIQIYQYNGSKAQIFKLKKVSSDTSTEKTADVELKEGTYTIVSALNDSMVVDVKNASVDRGANIQLYKNNGTNAQKFIVKKNRNGNYTITSKVSGKVLSVQNNQSYDNANVQQENNQEQKGQQWKIVPVGNGYYKLFETQGGRALDVRWGETANGTNIQIYTTNDTLAQRFRFKLTQ